MAPTSSAEFIPLLGITRHAVEAAARGSHWQPDATALGPALVGPGACFVTLMRETRLRGCIGSLEACRPLFEDAAANAAAAAVRDPRFAPLKPAELDRVHIEISILGPPSTLAVSSRAELLAMLVPGEDGLIVADGLRRATFLPSVWAHLPEPESFLGRLLEKAGLSADHWTPELRFSRYRTRSLREQTTPG